jgi:hypothetical protein
VRNLQREIVAIFLLDPGHQGQQQIPRRYLVGGERQTACAI